MPLCLNIIDGVEGELIYAHFLSHATAASQTMRCCRSRRRSIKSLFPVTTRARHFHQSSCYLEGIIPSWKPEELLNRGIALLLPVSRPQPAQTRCHSQACEFLTFLYTPLTEWPLRFVFHYMHIFTATTSLTDFYMCMSMPPVISLIRLSSAFQHVFIFHGERHMPPRDLLPLKC